MAHGVEQAFNGVSICAPILRAMGRRSAAAAKDRAEGIKVSNFIAEVEEVVRT